MAHIRLPGRLSPFILDTAIQEARMAEDAWNIRDPERVAASRTADGEIAQSSSRAGPRSSRSCAGSAQ
jgi:nuclear transport factor 2 (NTF2) superfamily protein